MERRRQQHLQHYHPPPPPTSTVAGRSSRMIRSRITTFQLFGCRKAQACKEKIVESKAALYRPCREHQHKTEFGTKASKKGHILPTMLIPNRTMCLWIVLKRLNLGDCACGSKKPHKHKDATNHGFWYLQCLGPQNQDVASLYLCGFAHLQRRQPWLLGPELAASCHLQSPHLAQAPHLATCSGYGQTREYGGLCIYFKYVYVHMHTYTQRSSSLYYGTMACIGG